MPGPQGQTPENKERFAKNRNPKQVLEGLESTHQPILANNEEEVSGESDDGETIERDNEKSMANFDPLVKPRIPKPPIEKTRQREKEASSQRLEVNEFSDPFWIWFMEPNIVELQVVLPFLHILSSLLEGSRAMACHQCF
jgi:hypothetical protein